MHHNLVTQRLPGFPVLPPHVRNFIVATQRATANQLQQRQSGPARVRPGSHWLYHCDFRYHGGPLPGRLVSSLSQLLGGTNAKRSM